MGGEGKGEGKGAAQEMRGRHGRTEKAAELGCLGVDVKVWVSFGEFSQTGGVHG